MKLLIATGLYPPEIGGPATYVQMLERRLPAKGFKLLVLPFSHVRQYPKFLRHVLFGWRVWKQAKEVDIVYALDPVSVGLPSYIAAKLRGKKFILRLGGDYAWEQGRVRFGLTDTLDEYTENRQKSNIAVRFLAKIQTIVTKGAAVVVAPSEYLKKVITTWGVNPNQVHVIYSSLVPIRTTVDRETIKQERGLGHPVLSTAGRLVPWKGMLVLIEVVNTLKEKFPDITLNIIGDGPQESLLKSLVAKYGLEKKVIFSGRLEKNELANVIAASDVFVLNTAYEGLSHQLLEVMDLGVPIVTTTSGGNVELLSDDDNALLVPFNSHRDLEEALVKILKNNETSHRLVQSARLRSKDFTEDIVIDHLVHLLKTVYEA